MECRLIRKKSDFTGDGETGTKGRSVGIRRPSGVREKEEWEE